MRSNAHYYVAHNWQLDRGVGMIHSLQLLLVTKFTL